MILKTLSQDEISLRVDPRQDSVKVIDQANRAASFIFQDVADRDARNRQIGDLVTGIREKFDSYDEALADGRRREADLQERASALETEMFRLRHEHQAALSASIAKASSETAALKSAHMAEISGLNLAHQSQMEEARDKADEDVSRMREGVEHLKADLGDRFEVMERRLRELTSDNVQLLEDKASLTRSITSLITAVEAHARSLQAEEGAIAAIVDTVTGQTGRIARSGTGSDIIPFPQKQLSTRADLVIEEAQFVEAAGRSAV